MSSAWSWSWNVVLSARVAFMRCIELSAAASGPICIKRVYLSTFYLDSTSQTRLKMRLQKQRFTRMLSAIYWTCWKGQPNGERITVFAGFSFGSCSLRTSIMRRGKESMVFVGSIFSSARRSNLIDSARWIVFGLLLLQKNRKMCNRVEWNYDGKVEFDSMMCSFQNIRLNHHESSSIVVKTLVTYAITNAIRRNLSHYRS